MRTEAFSHASCQGSGGIGAFHDRAFVASLTCHAETRNIGRFAAAHRRWCRGKANTRLKGFPSLGKDSKRRDELCKDVTAFANSAGGQFVYGMEEDKTFPTKPGNGADPSITKEWLEPVIDSRVQPRIDGLVITPIQLAKGLVLSLRFCKRHQARLTKHSIRSTISVRTSNLFQWKDSRRMPERLSDRPPARLTVCR